MHERPATDPVDFGAYKNRYRLAIRQALAEAEPGRLDEAAFPAYSHRNPVINWLFWQRLRKVMEHVQRSAPYDHVLDFGCGSGVMLPFLSGMGSQVTAMDVDLLPLETVRRQLPLAANVVVRDATRYGCADMPEGSLDLIVALDVLEHIKDLKRILTQLFGLLRPGGSMIISGPTENVLYRMGRRLAGPEYSGAYHERGIAEIRSELGRLARVDSLGTLYWPVPLFEILAATKR